MKIIKIKKNKSNKNQYIQNYIHWWQCLLLVENPLQKLLVI